MTGHGGVRGDERPLVLGIVGGGSPVSVTIECTVPAADFTLGRAFRDTEGVRFELERTVPTREAIVPFVWVYDSEHEGDKEAIAAGLRADPGIETVRAVDERDDRVLFRLEWAVGIDGLVGGLLGLDVTVLRAEGTAERWRFELRFPDEGSASAFQAACEDAGVSLDVERVYDLTGAGDRGKREGTTLTPAQREVLIAALEGGYFAVPRETNLINMSEELGVSDQAVGERMRRAMATLARSAVITDSGIGDERA